MPENRGGMKFASARQRRYMFAVVPDAAKKWAHGRKTRKGDWRKRRPAYRADSEEVAMPEIVIGAATEEDIAAIMQCLVASGISLTLTGDEIVEEVEMNEEDLTASAAIVAAVGDEFKPPAEWFTDPQLAEPQRWTTVTADGRVYGHTALWGECHIGYPSKCITPEMISQGGFDYANGIGHVLTAAGEQVGTSPLAVKGGHAPLEWDWKRAKAHYDDPSTVVADVVYGTDDHGIWFSGSLRPSATPEMVYALRASGVSGDWREIDGQTRLLASCCVNNGGFPKMKARVNGDKVLSMVAAGGDPEPDPTLKCCGQIEEVVEDKPLGVQQMIDIMNGKPIVASSPSIEERLSRLEGMLSPIASHYQNEVLASLSDRLTNA